jgi:hypothetical protein
MEEDLAARIADLEHVNQNLQAMVEDLERRNEWLWREIGALRIEKAKASSPGLNTHLAPHSGPLKALGRVLQIVQHFPGPLRPQRPVAAPGELW